MNSPVNQIKERLTIEEVVSSYIPLVKVGNTLKAKCPFHNEKTPSFFVSNERNSYYCFGCGKGGDIFNFVEEFEGLDFKGALKLLAEKANVSLSDFVNENQDEKDQLYAVMEEATKYFENNLKHNQIALDYLKGRGLLEETIKSFRIGFANDTWRDLVNFLVKKNFKYQTLEKAGLIKRKDETDKNYEKAYDRFRNRIMFPIMDSSSRVIAFSGRYLGKDEKIAKYLNSPETPIFNKGNVLYGLNFAKEFIRRNNFVILVEGQMDLILSHQINFRNTVATSGTAFSGEIFDKEKNISNLGLVRRLSNNIVIAFDGDKAGMSATKRASKIALDLGMDVKVTNIQGGLDPADFISQNGKEGWKEVIKNSKHIIESILDNILDEFRDDNRKVGKLVKEELLPYLVLLSSEIDRNHFLDLISKKTMIPIEALRGDFKNLLLSQESIWSDNREVNPFLNKDEVDYISREKKIINWLLGIIFWQKELKNNILDLEKIIKNVEKILKKDLNTLLQNREINKEELVFKVEEFYSNKDEDFINQDAKELLKELYILDLENKAVEMQNDLNNIDILQAYNLIKIEIENIKNGRFNFE